MWQKLEERGRKKLKLGQSWCLFYVDLDKCGHGWAEVKFTRKNEHGEFMIHDTAFGNIQYSDFK